MYLNTHISAYVMKTFKQLLQYLLIVFVLATPKEVFHHINTCCPSA